MKVLKILAVVFGVLVLLTGAGLLAGSFAAGKGDDAMQRSMQSSGLAGPVDGVVKAVDGQQVTVDYTDEQGEDHTAQGQAALTKPAEVGDTVSVYYSVDQPDIVVVTDILGGSLTKLASGLRTGGIVGLVVGGLLLLAGILGLVLGKKTPAMAVGSPQGQPYPQPDQQYPAQQYPAQPGQQYPGQPGQQYPAQPGQQYPGQPGQPGQQYPGHPGPLPAPYSGPYPSQPGQQYPEPPGQYPPPQGQPEQYPPPGPPSAQ